MATTYMKFKTEGDVHMALNCPVELDILEVDRATSCWYAQDDTTSYVVSTAKHHRAFPTFDKAVLWAEHKFGVVMEWA